MQHEHYEEGNQIDNLKATPTFQETGVFLLPNNPVLTKSTPDLIKDFHRSIQGLPVSYLNDVFDSWYKVRNSTLEERHIKYRWTLIAFHSFIRVFRDYIYCYEYDKLNENGEQNLQVLGSINSNLEQIIETLNGLERKIEFAKANISVNPLD